MYILILTYIIGCCLSCVWAFDDWISNANASENGEENIFKILKHITWGRLVFSILFLPGVIVFYMFAFIIWSIVNVLDWFDSKRPLKFLKEPVFNKKLKGEK